MKIKAMAQSRVDLPGVLVYGLRWRLLGLDLCLFKNIQVKKGIRLMFTNLVPHKKWASDMSVQHISGVQDTNALAFRVKLISVILMCNCSSSIAHNS